MPWNAKKTATFRRLLLAWYVRNRRDLPWRLDPTPYRVWISEIMLQQTRVGAAVPYYLRFLERFPDVRSLAAAREAEVLALWAGLGYYSRARNLLRAARIIVSEYQGAFPDGLQEIRDLPGVGRYTAGAIYSIAFNCPEPVVDGNVRRVLGRLYRIDQPAPDSIFWETATALISPRRASDFNQAMMELGALICTPSDPECGACPVNELCYSRGMKNPERAGKKAGVTIELVILVASRKGRTLVCRNCPVSFIPGSWFLPIGLVQKGESTEKVAGRLAGVRGGLVHAGRIRHAITSRRIVADVYALKRGIRIVGGRWVEANRIGDYLISSLFVKACQKVNHSGVEE
jgi:A/G-specific adenine glycosylase